jgi:Transmembrane amino acid transporter protein
MGQYFFEHYIKFKVTEMEQNCMNMFPVSDPLAFIMRFALFALLFCCFPLINHFLRSLCFQLFFRDKEITDKIFYGVNVVILIVPALITIFYPKIGSILGLIGAVAGLFIVYILPVITHLKKFRTELEHPLLAKAIQEDQYEFRATGTTEFKSPKIAIRRQVPGAAAGKSENRISSNTDNAGGAAPVNLKPYYWECFTHSLIIIYGLIILVFTFYNPLKSKETNVCT